MGLKEQIRNANSDSEISSLLSKGKSFEFASENTRRAWKSTARVRLEILNSKDVVQTTEKSTDPKKSPKKKKDRVAQ